MKQLAERCTCAPGTNQGLILATMGQDKREDVLTLSMLYPLLLCSYEEAATTKF